MSEPWQRKEVIGGCTLYLGDCLDILPSIGGVSAVITDPPYAIPTQVASGRSVTRNVGALSIVEGAFRQHIQKWKEILGEKGRIFVFCDGASYPIIFRAAYGSFNIASLVWDKKRFGMGREFRKRHELILHGWGAETPVVSSNGVGVSDIIECAPVPKKVRIHPAQKPSELIGSLLRVCDGPVLDPFMGSGSTAIAALSAGLPFIGCEIDGKIFEEACARIEEAVDTADAVDAMAEAGGTPWPFNPPHIDAT